MRIVKTIGSKFWFKMLLAYSACIYIHSYQAAAFPTVKAPQAAFESSAPSRPSSSLSSEAQATGAVHLAAMRVAIGQQVQLFDGEYVCELEVRAPFATTPMDQDSVAASN